MKLKNLIITSLIVSIIVGIIIGFGIVELFKLLGANLFQPSSILHIYLFGIVISMILISYIVKKKKVNN